MTTNERFSRRNDGDNNSTISRSLMDSSNTNDNTSALLSTQNDTLLRSTFMGPKNGSWMGNWFRMCFYTPPTQQKMRFEYM